MNLSVPRWASRPPVPTAMWKMLMPESLNLWRSAAVKLSGFENHFAPSEGLIDERAEHVYYGGPLHQLNRPRRVGSRRECKQAIAPAIDHRRR